MEAAAGCIRRGASQVVLMLGEADQFRTEVDFYRQRFIPAVTAAI